MKPGQFWRIYRSPMQFEDIAHKYRIRSSHSMAPEISTVLVKKLSDEVINLIHCPSEVTIGYFKDEVIARNVALALEFFKLNNKNS